MANNDSFPLLVDAVQLAGNATMACAHPIAHLEALGPEA